MEYSKHPLFHGMNIEEIQTIFHDFLFIQKQYDKNEYLLLCGDWVTQIGLILEGTIHMEKEDYYGNYFLFMELHQKDIFGEPFISNYVQRSSINYKAHTKCLVLFFQYQMIWNHYDNLCLAHNIFIKNLMTLQSQKIRYMMKKVEIISKTHMRDRILTYFQLLHEEQGCQNEHIFIPYNRTELSKYLCVNRSAMVRELGKLKVEGILDYADIHSVILKNIKNQFK